MSADTNGVGCLGRQHAAAGRAGMQRMIGREGGADFDVGDDARVQALGQGDARLPGIKIARHASGEHDRMLGVAKNSAACLVTSAEGALSTSGM